MVRLAATLAGATALAGLLAAPAAAQTYVPDLLPPSSAPGECYARVKIPAKHQSVTQTVMTEAPHETLRTTEPQFQTRQESVLVKEPSVRYEVRQPTFRTVTERIQTRPAYERLSVTPPRFSTVTETLNVAPPRLVWKKGNPGELRRQGYIIHSTADAGAGGRGYNSTVQFGHSGGERCGPSCEIWCLVEEPAVSQTFQRRVMASPGEVRRQSVPAQFQTITKQVVADPGGVREVKVPGEFRNITVHDLVAPADVVRQSVPPKFGTLTSQVVAEDERYEWRRVVCQPGTGTIQGVHSGGHFSGHSSSHSTGGHSTGGHLGGSHSGHTHGADHFSSQSHSGSVHSGHAHAAGQHPVHGAGYNAGASYSSGTSYGSGSVYSQPGFRQGDELAGGRGGFETRR